MARLMLRALALLASLAGSAPALAEPVTLAIGTWFATASAFTIASVVFTVLSTAASIYGSIQTKKKARAAAQRAAEVEAANLKDRTASIVASDSPWPVIYGQPAPVGGSVVAMLTSGDADQFKHVVLVLASHECEAVDDIYIAGDHVGTLSSAGYASNPLFAVEGGVPLVATQAFELVAVSEGGENGGMTPDGYAALPVGLDADGFELIYVRNQAGADYGSVIGISTSSPLGFGSRALVGPIGAKGTVSYRYNGSGSALNVQIHLSPGGVDTADAFLRAARPDLWTVDHKLSGYTYLVVTMNLLLERFQGGVPEITARVRGKKVYDYRTGQTLYSRNPALCLADFIRSEAGYGASAAQIETDAVIAAANACDFGVYDPGVVVSEAPTYGYSHGRYICDGMFRTDQDRDATRQQLEDAMIGFSLESGGVWRIQAGAWSTPVLSLTDDDMVMPTAIVQTCNVGTARYNGAKGTYVNATRLGVTEDFTPYQNSVFRAQDVKDKFLDCTLSFIGNYIRCRQFGRVMVEQSRGGFVVQIFPKMHAWNLQPGDRIVLSSALYAFTNKTFRVQDWTYQAGTPVALQCVEDEEAFYDQEDETRADAAPNTQLPSPFLRPSPPLDLVVQSGEAQMAQQNGTLVVRARVSWAQSQDPMVLQGGTVRVQWRRTSNTDDWETTDLPGDSTSTYLLGLEVNRVYVVRVQFLTAYASSLWSVAQHALVGLEGVPDGVANLALSVERTGIVATWTMPAGIDLLGWAATQIRRGETWALGEGTVLFDGQASSANLGWFPAGTHKVWAAHHNTSGQWSVPVSVTITIAAPAQPLVTGSSAVEGVNLSWQDCKTTQPLATYRISSGTTQAAATLRGSTLSTKYYQGEVIIASRRYWVVAVDAGGNVSAGGYLDLMSGGDINTTINAATAELRSGLDTVTSQITNPATGLAAIKLMAEAAAQGQAVQYLEQADDLHTLAQTTLRSILQQSNGTRSIAVARSELFTRLGQEASQRLQLALSVGQQEGRLTQIAQVMSDQYGNLSARWGVTLDINGRITGVELLGTGEQTTAVWLVDKFGIGLPGANGQTVYPFIVGTVQGQPAVAINGNLYVDGGIISRHLAAGIITADKMAANSITAANAALGDASVETLKIAGQAVTVPAYLAGATNNLSMNYSIPGSGSYVVYIHAVMTMSVVGLFEIYVDGALRYSGAAIGGTLASVAIVPGMTAGNHVIRLYSDRSENSNNAALFALALKR